MQVAAKGLLIRKHHGPSARLYWSGQKCGLCCPEKAVTVTWLHSRALKVLIWLPSGLLYIPLRPQTTRAREKLKTAADALQPIWTIRGSPCKCSEVVMPSDAKSKALLLSKSLTRIFKNALQELLPWESDYAIPLLVGKLLEQLGLLVLQPVLLRWQKQQ